MDSEAATLYVALIDLVSGVGYGYYVTDGFAIVELTAWTFSDYGVLIGNVSD